jgi:hypothetical protein
MQDFLEKAKAKIACLLFLVSIASVFGIVGYEHLAIGKIDADNSVKRGIDFLFADQKSYGEFGVQECQDESLTQCTEASSPFGTTFVLYSLSGVKNEKAEAMIAAGTRFLQSEKLPGGLWSYYTKRNTAALTPDLDDTAMASFVLKQNGYDVSENTKVFEQNRNEKNIFYTWVNIFGGSNDIDCAANANMLMYLQKNDPAVCRYINEEVTKAGNCSPYYPDKLAVYYVVSRAAKEGVSCLEENKNQIIKNILELQKQDGSFGSDIQNAFAVNALLNFGYDREALGKGLRAIIGRQEKDGSWKAGAAWFTVNGRDSSLFYGSRALTTALSVEALKRY